MKSLIWCKFCVISQSSKDGKIDFNYNLKWSESGDEELRCN